VLGQDLSDIYQPGDEGVEVPGVVVFAFDWNRARDGHVDMERNCMLMTLQRLSRRALRRRE